MINLDESIRAVYFLSGRDCDWLAAVSADGGGLQLRWRFRYYAPDDPGNDPHSDKDRKNWYSARSSAPLPDVLAGMQGMVDAMLAAGFVPRGGVSCKLVRGSMSLEQFFEEFRKLPFVHTRVEKAPR